MSLLRPEPCPWHFFSIPHLFWPPYLQAVSKNRAKLWYQCKHNVLRQCLLSIEHWTHCKRQYFNLGINFGASWSILFWLHTNFAFQIRLFKKISLKRQLKGISQAEEYEKQNKLISLKCLLGEQPKKIKSRWKQMPLATSRRGQCMWEGNMDKCCLDSGWGKAPLADTCLKPNWDPGLSSGSHWFKKGPTILVRLYPETLEFMQLHKY